MIALENKAKSSAMFLSFGAWSPEAYGSRCVFVCVFLQKFFQSLLSASAETQTLKYAMQAECSIMFKMKSDWWLYSGVMAWFTTDCFSTRQLYLYHKVDNELS